MFANLTGWHVLVLVLLVVGIPLLIAAIGVVAVILVRRNTRGALRTGARADAAEVGRATHTSHETGHRASDGGGPAPPPRV